MVVGSERAGVFGTGGLLWSVSENVNWFRKMPISPTCVTTYSVENGTFPWQFGYMRNRNYNHHLFHSREIPRWYQTVAWFILISSGFFNVAFSCHRYRIWRQMMGWWKSIERIKKKTEECRRWLPQGTLSALILSRSAKIFKSISITSKF